MAEVVLYHHALGLTEGALLFHACAPVTEFGEGWPDPSLPSHDQEAAALLMDRVLDFLGRCS